MRTFSRLLPLVVLALLAACSAFAHDGRRFAIEIVDNRLQAQGINTGPDDGAPAFRPYLNSLHDHWTNSDSNSASASLPGFDVTPSAATRLLGHRLELELLGVRRWDNPAAPPFVGAPLLSPLASGDSIYVHGPDTTLSSDSPGVMTLLDEITFGGVQDIDVVYEADFTPLGEIHVLDLRLIASRLDGGGASILPSATIHVLLSPDGATPQERLHHASLYLESYLATVPEPASGAVVALGIVLFRLRPLARR